MSGRYYLSLWKYDKNRRPRYFCNLKYHTNDYDDIKSIEKVLTMVMGDIFEIRIGDQLD